MNIIILITLIRTILNGQYTWDDERGKGVIKVSADKVEIMMTDGKKLTGVVLNSWREIEVYGSLCYHPLFQEIVTNPFVDSYGAFVEYSESWCGDVSEAFVFDFFEFLAELMT